MQVKCLCYLSAEGLQASTVGDMADESLVWQPQQASRLCIESCHCAMRIILRYSATVHACAEEGCGCNAGIFAFHWFIIVLYVVSPTLAACYLPNQAGASPPTAYCQSTITCSVAKLFH